MTVTAWTLAGQTAPPAVSAADGLFAQSKWPEATTAYQSIAAVDPGNVQVWQNLGEALLQQHKAAQAREAFQHALDLHSRPVFNQLNIARTYADENDRAHSLSVLQKLIAAGSGGIIRPMILSAAEFKCCLAGLQNFANSIFGLEIGKCKIRGATSSGTTW
jgi:tetratricopeptide (TPR) repeat protein